MSSVVIATFLSSFLAAAVDRLPAGQDHGSRLPFAARVSGVTRA